jgi:hypothetical protein
MQASKLAHDAFIVSIVMLSSGLKYFLLCSYTESQLSVAVMDLFCDSFHIFSGGCEGDPVVF